MEKNQRTIKISFEFGRRQLVAVIALGLLALTPGDLVTEQLTLTTYYPSPYGVYEELRSTNGTYLSYLGGNTCVGSNGCATKFTVTGASSVSGSSTVGGNLSVTGTSYVGSNSTIGGYADVGGYVRSRNSRAYYFGTSNQYIYGDNSSAIYYNGMHDTVVQLIMRDRQNTIYGRVYGDGNGSNFGTLDGDGNWALLQVKDNYTQLRINNSAKITLRNNNRHDINGRLGIGNSNPSYPLDVSGDARITGLIRNGCQWRSYGIGSSVSCQSGWTTVGAATSSGRISHSGSAVWPPTSGKMLCCRLQFY